MYSICKYKLREAESISAEEPYAWVSEKVDSKNSKFYHFEQIGIGRPFDEDVEFYSGTIDKGSYVWHYFIHKKMNKNNYDKLKKMIFSSLIFKESYSV